MCHQYIVMIPITKPWMVYGGTTGLIWEPWSYLGFFSLPILQKTWPDTNKLKGATYIKDIKDHISALTKNE